MSDEPAPRCVWDTEDGPCPNNAIARITLGLPSPNKALEVILEPVRPTCKEHGRQVLRILFGKEEVDLHERP